jgi:hypothetical protein
MPPNGPAAKQKIMKSLMLMSVCFFTNTNVRKSLRERSPNRDPPRPDLSCKFPGAKEPPAITLDGLRTMRTEATTETPKTSHNMLDRQARQGERRANERDDMCKVAGLSWHARRAEGQRMMVVWAIWLH